MAQTDLTSLLTGISAAPISPMAGMNREGRMAQRAQGFADRTTRGMLSAAGKDPRTLGQQAQAALAGLDINNPKDQPKIMEIVSRVNPERAAQLQAQIALQQKERDQTTSFSTFVTNKYGTEFGKLAAEGVLTPDNMDDFISDLQDANNQKGGTYTVQDSQGNDYTMIPSFDKQRGKTVNTYSPITPGAPATPVGKVVITGGEFAQTAGEAAAYELKTDSEKEQETTYQEQRVEMVATMPELNAKYANLQRAEDLLATVPTGGPVNIIGTGLETFFGKKPKDKAELEIIFGLEMLKSLKPFFGGVISDSESKRLEDIYAGLEKGSEANKGILATLKKELDNAMKKAELYRNAKTFKDFETTMGVMFPAGQMQVDSPDVIDFNDLD